MSVLAYFFLIEFVVSVLLVKYKIKNTGRYTFRDSNPRPTDSKPFKLTIKKPETTTSP